MENPEDLFKDYTSYEFNTDPSLTFEQRLAAIRNMGKKAQQDFDVKFENINKWFVDYDQPYILSFCLRYFIMHKEGYDEEAVKGSYSFAPHYIELLQALSLASERTYSTRPLMHNMERLKADMKEVGKLSQMKLFNIPDKIKTPQELSVYRVRTDVMGYNMAVRNWAYYHQMQSITETMGRLVREEFMKEYGICPEELIKLFFTLVNQVIERTNNHIKKIRAVFAHENYMDLQDEYDRTFMGALESNKEAKEKLWNNVGKDIKELRFVLLGHSDMFLSDLSTFTLDEMVTYSSNNLGKEPLRRLLDLLSYKYGDLKDHKKEHIIFDNPIHTRPFIQLDNESYYSSIWQSIPHLAITILESLMEKNEGTR